MDENIQLLETAMRELQAARRSAVSKRVRTYLRLALARINLVHRNLNP